MIKLQYGIGELILFLRWYAIDSMPSRRAIFSVCVSTFFYIKKEKNGSSFHLFIYSAVYKLIYLDFTCVKFNQDLLAYPLAESCFPHSPLWNTAHPLPTSQPYISLHMRLEPCSFFPICVGTSMNIIAWGLLILSVAHFILQRRQDKLCKLEIW